MALEVSLFLGAGFSKWSADLPLVSELFDFTIEPTSRTEERRLERIRKDWDDWNGANDTSTPEQFIYWALNRSSHRRSRVVWYISRRLSDPFMTKIEGSYSPLMFDERRAKEHPGVMKALTLMNWFSHCTLASKPVIVGSKMRRRNPAVPTRCMG